MGRKGRGKGPSEKDGGGYGSAGMRGQPQPMQHEDFSAAGAGGHLWPLTPLGVPRNPPPVPPLPDWVMCSTMAQAAPGYGTGTYDASAPGVPPFPDHIAGLQAQAAATGPQGGGQLGQENGWEFETRADRRTFFHGEGKSLTFHNNPSTRHSPEEMIPLGSQVMLNVEEVHFGNVRVGTMSKDPAILKDMLKWGPEEFAKYPLDCAQITFGGSYWVWCAQGIRSNRVLYAAKRCGLESIGGIVVPAPKVTNEEEIDLTYGASIQGIQLVPL